MTVQPDYDTIHKSLRWLIGGEERVAEIRTIEQYRHRSSVGYFNDLEVASNAACQADIEGLAGVYVTLNPVHKDAALRVKNRMVDGRAGMFTTDKEILERRGLLLDFDPKRDSLISGISSTDEEHERALQFMYDITADLTHFHGFPVPCLIDSGNGGHAKYFLDALPNDIDSTNLIKAVLHCMHERYKNPLVDIDRTVFNASRIVRIPGTVARKGENSRDRPHRVSRIIHDYDPLDTLSKGTLERFAGMYGHLIPQKAKSTVGHVQRFFDYPPQDEVNWRRLNSIARDRIHDWVPNLLPGIAYPTGDSYRITSETLGRNLQESISITPTCIKDFGVADMGDQTEGLRTPITLLSEVLLLQKHDVARMLAMALGVPVNAFEGNPLLPPPVVALDASGEPVVMPESLMGRADYALPKNGYADVDLLGGMDRSNWLIKDFLIEDGYTLVSAPTKMGKSSLTKQMIASCLLGSPLLGSPCPQVEVLYIAYEDMEQDIIPDIRHILRETLKEQGVILDEIPGRISEAMKGFHFYAREKNEAGEFLHRVPTGRAGLDFIAKLCSETLPNVRVICVDPLRLLRDETIRSRDIVTQQYHEGLDFVSLCIKAKAAVWGLHHNNKESGKKMSDGNDPLLSAGGTAAIAGSAQNVIVFEGDRIPEGVDGAIGFYISPRIGQTRKKIVKFHQGRFYQVSSDTEIYYHRSQAKETKDPQCDLKITAYLDQNGRSISNVVADALNIPKYTVDRRLDFLRERGIVDFMVDKEATGVTGRGPKPRLWFALGSVQLPKAS